MRTASDYIFSKCEIKQVLVLSNRHQFILSQHLQFFDFLMNSNPKPVETGKEYTVNITDNGSAGDGIARIDGLVIFVKDAKAGYRNVKIKINSVKDRFATAELAANSVYSN